ncbi:MAG TPA: LON peptidase substrate-binding domain-containing protein [Caulobacteraceae bacterium]|jgi:ATP-dependent Lon protease
MRDFRDAKAMAQSLREALATKSVTISHSESLELIAKALGTADWNTLSASITQEAGETSARPSAKDGPLTLPAFPIRDMVPFPAMQFPLFIGRQKTVRALTDAFACRRELVLAAQKARDLDEPGPDDVYDVGVVARVIDVGPVSSDWLARHPEAKGDVTKVLLQTERRVKVRRFSAEGDGYQAEIEEIDEGTIPNAPDLIQKAATRFGDYSAAHDVPVADISPPLGQLHDPGRVADVIAVRIHVPISERQAILATLDPVARLQRVVVHLEA